MDIILNGASRPIAEGSTVADLVRELGFEGKRIAVELNLRIVRREQYAAEKLAPGDTVEIVHFVGGG